MKNWYPYLSKKSKRFFIFWTVLNALFLIGGIVMMCFGMVASGSYGFILLIPYIPFYYSNVDLGEARKKSHDMGLPPIENYKTMK
jgi:hypothetical protein